MDQQRGKQSVCFFHITTPSRTVYFIEGDEAARISHGGYITSVLDPVSINHSFQLMFNPFPFRLFRTLGPTGSQLLALTILVIPKVCAMTLSRSISPFWKFQLLVIISTWQLETSPSFPISRRSFFPDFRNLGISLLILLAVMPTLSGILQFFGKSVKSGAVLKDLHQEVGISQGLEMIGKTRFATVWRGSMSLQENFQLITELVEKKQLITKKVCCSIFFSESDFNNPL